MELMEYVKIFRKFIVTYIVVVLIFVCSGLGYFFLQKESYKAVLTLNVTRKGVQETNNYQFDEFYRLQADERFADTVVRWINSPRLSAEILNGAEITTTGLSAKNLENFFKAERLSSQVIKVSYVTSDINTEKQLAVSMMKVVQNQVEELNKFQKSENWFLVIGDDPLIRNNQKGIGYILLFSLILGLFFGFWVVLFRNYFSNFPENKEAGIVT